MRVIKKNLLAITSVLTLSAFSTAVSAACNVDLRGEWSSYNLASTNQYSNCNYTMDRDGNLQDGSACSVYTWDGSFEYDAELDANVPVLATLFDNYPATGQYVVADDCTASGIIKIGVVNLTVRDARVNNSRDAVRGIQYDDFNNKFSPFEMFRVD